MTDLISNTDLYNVLLDIREDLGGLKTSSGMQLQTLNDHTARLGKLESGADTQRGALKVWGLLGFGVASAVGAAADWFLGRHNH